MNALLLTKYMGLELVEMPKPAIGPEDVLVRVAACGICGSDVHGFDGSSGRRIPPIVMGHEAAGVVAETGSNVMQLKAGDRVTFDSMVSCGACFFCRRGDPNLCDHRQVLGVACEEFRRDGAFADYVAVPQRIVYQLPDSLSFAHAAMIEPLSVAVHAVNLTPVKLGDTAVVAGSGMIGLLVIQALRLAGASRIIAVDIDDARLKLAAGLGATEQVNASTTDVAARIRSLTGGRGADVAIEAVGVTEPIAAAIASLRKGGALTLVGNSAPKIELPLQSVVTRQIHVTGSCASSNEYPACIELLSRGAIRVEPLISAKAPLAEGPAWFHRLYNREPNLMKVILEP
jgi:L-iditol 2-dehydrogenase